MTSGLSAVLAISLVLVISARAAGPDAASPSLGKDAAQNLQAASPGDVIKSLQAALLKKDAKAVLELAIPEYRQTAKDVSKVYHISLWRVVQYDFGYKITGVNKVIIRKGVAFVEVNVTHSAEGTRELKQDEKEGEGLLAVGGLWAFGNGGTTHTVKCQMDGAGRATQILVLQGGEWKIAFTVFSLDPLPPDYLRAAAQAYQDLVRL